jgi:hypothetical protein
MDETAEVIIERVKRLDAIMGVDGFADVKEKTAAAVVNMSLARQCKRAQHADGLAAEFIALRRSVDLWQIRREAADAAIDAFEAKVKAALAAKATEPAAQTA